MSFLPLTDEQLQDHEFSPAEFSFTVDNAWNIEKFVNEGIPQIEAMGLTVTFDDGGWLEVVDSYESAQRLAVIRIVLLVLVTVIATVFIVYLYITRRRKDYAIMRALGTGGGKSSSALLLPLMVLGVAGVIIGAFLGILYTLLSGGAVFLWAVCLCVLSEILLMLIFALFMLRKLGRLSPLALLQDTSKNKKKRTAVQKSDTAETNDLSLDGVLSGVPHTETGIKDFRGTAGPNGDICDASIHVTPAADSIVPPVASSSELMPKRSHRLVRFVTGYVLRHARRQAVKSLLAVLLAVLMVGAVTQFAKMKDSYSDLRRDTVVTARFNASLPLFQLRSLEGGGFAANSYYEYTREYDINHNDRGDNFNRAYITITNDIPRYTNEECTIEYAPGYDDTVMDKLGDVIIMSSALMETMGYELGDTVRITPGGYTDEFINKLRINFKDEHPELQTVPDALYTTYGEYIESAIDEMADVFTIVGVVTTPSGAYDSFAFTPGQVDSLSNMGSAVTLDIAEFRLADNELADKMMEKGKELTRGQTGAFVMDTSKLDSVIRTSEILNSLYPAAVAAALVIGAFLCALIIFQTSTEAAIMRVLGTTKKKTAAILTAEQCILALLGIILGILITAVINGGVSAQSLIFSGAYFAVILLGSAISSVLVTRRNILDLLQTKE